MSPRHERLLTVPLVLGICLAAAAGSGTVFYQTQYANPTVEEYFSFLTIGRLLILTHVHSFGYTTMCFLLWTQGRRMGAAESPRFAQLLALTVAAGVADVLSWWGIVYIDPVFRFLTFAAGGGFVGGVVLSALLVLRACLRPREAR